MKKITISRGPKILCLLLISGGLVFLSILGPDNFSFATDLIGNSTNLSISIPDNSIIMTPAVSVSGTATDNMQISSITWNVDERNTVAIPGIVRGTSVAWSFDISHLSNGLHTLQINVTNSIGSVTSKTISFTLYNDSPVPTASLSNGTYKGFQTVRIQTNDPALIFYTLDGSTPTLSSSHGTDSITLPEIRSNTILKYFAVDAYGGRSNVSTQVYVIDSEISPTPIVSNASNAVSSIPKIISTSENKTISETIGSITTLPKSTNVDSSKSIMTDSKNMTTVNTNSTLSVEVQSNSTSVPIIPQNMTGVNTNSTISTEVQSNSTSVPIIPQNMTGVNTNSTISILNQTNSTLNFSANGTR